MGEIKKMGTARKKTIVDLKTGEKMTDITPVDIYLSGPSGDMPFKITKEDVWGKFNSDYTIKLSSGMIVANYNEVCPIFGDIVPYKSVTVICDEDQLDDVSYWLEYVHGADSISDIKHIDGGKMAIRSNYMCW